MSTPASVVTQMLETAGDDLPERWKQKWRTMDSTWTGEKVENSLQDWLEETYGDSTRKDDLTKEDIIKVGSLIQRLLQFEPSRRASAQEILEDSWFDSK